MSNLKVMDVTAARRARPDRTTTTDRLAGHKPPYGRHEGVGPVLPTRPARAHPRTLLGLEAVLPSRSELDCAAIGCARTPRVAGDHMKPVARQMELQWQGSVLVCASLSSDVWSLR